MREITEAEKRKLWQQVQEEFPDDAVMQQIHFVRLVHHLQMRDLPASEQIEWLSQVPQAV